MSNGFVYILTNPCLDGWIKIGMTERDDIQSRLNELNSPSNIPLSYRCYAVYEVEDPRIVEENIHSLIDVIDNSLHARELLDNGRIREREFFKMSPEAAYNVLRCVASMCGNLDKLRLTEPTMIQSQEEELAEIRAKRSNNSFRLLNISIGEEIVFLNDNTIIAKVLDDKNKVKFEGNEYSVSALAKKILVERFGWSEGVHVNGWRYFVKNGITLSDLRNQIENEIVDE